MTVRLTVTPNHPCSYFADRVATSRAFYAPSLPGEIYRRFMDAGFRRSGRVIYQPICEGCRACVPIRVPVERFTPNKGQRRCWRKNQDLAVTIGAPVPTQEKFDLYEQYRRGWHKSNEEGDWKSFESFLYDSPVETLEMCYRDASGKLLGVGICDVEDQSLSSVYFYFDPLESRRSIGTFSALWELHWARQAGIPYCYLGYWVSGCGAMEYKANFRPFELLGTDGIWRQGNC